MQLITSGGAKRDCVACRPKMQCDKASGRIGFRIKQIFDHNKRLVPLMDTFKVAFSRPITCCLLFIACFSAEKACADDNQPATDYVINIRSCDEIWIVSSRQLDPCNFSPQQICVQQFCAGNWQLRAIEDLIHIHRNQIDKPLVMYVHGSRLDYYWARRRGLETYQDLTVAATAMPPIRYVIWHWPSEDHDRMLINYPRILRRSSQEGNVLGWFLAASGEGHRIGVLGYSLGVQVLGIACEVAHTRYAVTGGCQTVAIGAVTNCCWPQTAEQANAVLMGIGNMLVVENEQDKAVHAFEKACKLRRPGSLLGLDGLEQFDDANQMQRFDVTCIVNEKHQIHEYLKHACIARRVADHLVGREPSVETELILDNGSAIVDCEIFEHHEPGNPASNTRRKPFASK